MSFAFLDLNWGGLGVWGGGWGVSDWGLTGRRRGEVKGIEGGAGRLGWGELEAGRYIYRDEEGDGQDRSAEKKELKK